MSSYALSAERCDLWSDLNMNLRVDVLNYIFILPSIPGEYSIFSQLVLLCAALDLKILFSSIYSIQNFHTVLGLTKLNSNRAHLHFILNWAVARFFIQTHQNIQSLILHWYSPQERVSLVNHHEILTLNSNGPVFKTFTPPTSILLSVQLSLLMDAVQIFAPFLHRGRHDQMVCNDREKVSIVSIWIAPLKLDNEVLSLLLAALPSSGDDDNDGHVSASQPRIRIERHGKMWPAVCKH